MSVTISLLGNRRRSRCLGTGYAALWFLMRGVLFAVYLVAACATVSAADSYTDAVSAVHRGDCDLSTRLFRPLAEQEHAGAQSFLGVLYANGQGLPQNYAEAGRWYRRAAQLADASAQFQLGMLYVGGQAVPKDVIRAYLWLTVAVAGSRGDGVKTAIMNQTTVASGMTAAQIEQAQEMVRRCQETQFMQCE